MAEQHIVPFTSPNINTEKIKDASDSEKHGRAARRSIRQHKFRAQKLQLGAIFLALFIALLIGIGGSIFVTNYGDFIGHIFR